MEYQLVWATEPGGFQFKVRKALEAGWKPQGGVSVSSANASATALFAQAMVREPSPFRDR